MEVDFFLRYSLQRMCGTFGENQFDSKELLGINQEYIDNYIRECDNYVDEKAKMLAKKYNTSSINGKSVLFIGDSMTQDRVGYRSIVTKAAGLKAKNIAISGATSTDMLRLTYENIKGYKPEVVSVMIGTNDAYIYGGELKKSLVDADEYRKNIESILRDAKESGAAVVISTIPPMDEQKYAGGYNTEVKTNNNLNISEYNKKVRDEAEKNGAILIDLENALKKESGEMIEPDGIHLTRAGQVVMAELWIKAIERI